MDRPISDYRPESVWQSRMSAGKSGRAVQQMAQDQLQIWQKRIGEIIRENPGASLGAALGIGVFVGWLIKRR